MQLEFAEVHRRCKQLVPAARVMRCPSREHRDFDHCPFGGSKGLEWAAVKSGLAHLWSTLRHVDEAVAEAGLALERGKGR